MVMGTSTPAPAPPVAAARVLAWVSPPGRSATRPDLRAYPGPSPGQQAQASKDQRASKASRVRETCTNLRVTRWPGKRGPHLPVDWRMTRLTAPKVGSYAYLQETIDESNGPSRTGVSQWLRPEIPWS